MARRSSPANAFQRSQNSTVTRLVWERSTFALAQSFEASKRAAVFGSPAGPPGTPSVTPPCAEAELEPALSASVVPEDSPRRQ
jgi:hypothetical protein